ncbi:uncharacterized protein LOC143537772 [Bidens hawaiensis]|uniref:uncharacterized protein LOC143537772 n=1 Tax=Bidens hawaiensis TaxID=980011 RepID=UPI0040491A34
MEPVNRRRKLSNVNSFSGKNAYDGVLSGRRRPKYDGAPAVRVEEYGEIFSTTGQGECSSIPVLDVSSLEESCDDLEIWSRKKPDYGKIFGGFRDQDIAISYEELVARDNARVCLPSSASQSSQDLGDMSNQPLDALQQFRMAYNKISQRNKDGLDGTTQVTQLPAVSGFTRFIGESASQPKKETKNNKSVTNNIHPSLNSSKGEFPGKQTSQSTVDSRSRHQDESLSGERIVETFEADLKTHRSKVSSSLPAVSQLNKEIESRKSSSSSHVASQPNKETESEKSSSFPVAYQPNKETKSQKSSPPAVSQPNKETKSQTSSSSPAASQPNKETESQKSSASHPASQPNKETKSQKSSSSHPASQPSKEAKSQKSSSSPAASQPNKETKSQNKPSLPAASQPNIDTENQKSYITNNIHLSVNSSKGDFHEKQTSQSAVESRSRYGQDESLPGDGIFMTFEVDLKSHPSKVSSPPTASQPKKETENQKPVVTDNIHPNVSTTSKEDFHEKQTSQSAIEFTSRYQDESLLGDNIFKTLEADLKSHTSKVTSSTAASEPNKETESQKSHITNNIHPSVNSNKPDFPEKPTSQSTVDQDVSLLSDIIFKPFEADFKSDPTKISSSTAASEPSKETESQKSFVTYNIHPNVNSSKGGFHEKQTSQSAVESRNLETFEADLKSHTSKVSPPPAASQPNKESESQKSHKTNNIHPSENSSKGNFPEKQTSQSSVDSRSTYSQDESISDDRNFTKFQADLRSHTPKVASPPAVSATHVDNHKDYQKRTTATYGESPSNCFDEELDVNSAAAISAAALRKAIEKAQKSIRIAKESVGRKTGFSSRSFKDDLKVKAKDKMKERDYKHESTAFFSDFVDGQKLFGAKKVTNELHGKIPELGKNSEILIRSPVELRENKVVCNSKEIVGKTESIENNTCEGPQKDVEKPDHFLVLESCEMKLGDTKLNNLTVHQNVEDDKEIPVKSDETGDERKFSEESFGLFETKKQENLEQEHDEQVGKEEEQEEEEKERLYDVCEVEMIKNAETYDRSIETNDLSQNEDHEGKEKENDKAEETWEKLDEVQVPETYEKSSIDFDDTEESKSAIGASQIVNDTEEACKVDQNASNAEPSQQIDDVSTSSSSGHEFQVDETLTENEKTENVSSNETEDNKEECDAKSDDLANCGLTDMDFVQNDCSIETYDLSQKEEYVIKEEESHKAEETWQNLDKIQVPETYEIPSSDYNDAEASESVIGASKIVDDTEEVSKVDQKDNNVESSQEIDDVSNSSSSSHDFQVEDTEALEKEMIGNVSSDETEDNEDECDANCGLADVEFVQNNVQSESSSDTVLSMEIEVKEQKEREETAEKEDNNLQQPHEDISEVTTKMETGTQQEPENASRESDPSKTEQERIKFAVDRAICEARERAFAEVRQRVISETQEKVTKASSDKTSAQAKLKAERAAVERATAEARQRALEKAVSQKQMSEPKVQVKEINQTTNVESALRSKAKLEKDNRIMERAAKARAEKEMRDLLALREQAERNRLAENLDADIKRWSNGKEGNLRALLSTLQYILGAESGWQPVSLTDIITTSAVKKAYRKATLCVHPDKLQQRGATIQQKYICEKVFDLLKAAWNRFNSEER